MIPKANRLNTVSEYYFSKKLREVAQLKNEGKPIINIAIGSPDLPAPDVVINALQQALTLDNVNQYQSYQGIPQLREAMGNFYQKNYDVSLQPADEILPLMGSKEGIMHISMAFLNKGDAVLIPNPGYPTYASVTQLLECEPIFYNLNESNNWLPNLTELEQMDLSRVKLMWLSYPHMPTGASATTTLFEQLIQFAKKHKILLINDNPYSFILNNEPQSILAIPGAKDVALELNSLSKSFNMAGWRVGMVVGAASYLKTILDVKSNMDSGMFLAVQKGAEAALNLPQSWFTSLNKIYEERRKLVWQIMDALECTYSKSSTGLFVWAKLPLATNAISFTDDLLYNKHIFIAPGTIFGSNGEGYIRASLCVSQEVLQEVLNRVTTVNV
jgi:aspartate/methionine/tyrosine aminotransferase